MYPRGMWHIKNAVIMIICSGAEGGAEPGINAVSVSHRR